MLTEGLPCKIGTVPTVAKVHAQDLKRIRRGYGLRVKEANGDKWHKVYVTGFDRAKNGVITYFTADR